MKKLYVFLVGLLCGATFAQAQCTITLTANPNSPVCAGTAVHLTASGANTYVWTPGGLTGNSVTVNPTGTTTYTVIGTDLSSNTCSAFVVVTVNPTPTVTNTPLSQTICSGSHTSLVTLTSNVSGTNFTWTASATAGVTGFTTGSTNTLPVQTISTTATTQGTVTYFIVPTAAGCSGPLTNYTVLVNPLPTATTTPLSQTICSGAQTSVVILSSNVSGTTYYWTATATAGVTGWTPNGTNTIPATTISTTQATQGAVTYAITPDAAGCSGPTANYTVFVNPSGNASFNYASSTICQAGDDVSPIYDSITTTGVFSASPAGLVFLNTTTGLIDVSASATNTYTVTYTINGLCPSSSTTSLTIAPGNLVNVTVPSNITLCNGTVVASTVFSSTPPGATYTWTSSNPSIGMPASGSGNVPAFTATNTGTNTIYSVITVIPILSGYCSTPSAYGITVYPTPHMTVPANITACIGSPVPVTAFSSNLSGTTFAWTNSNPAIGLTAASGTSNLPAFTATNSGSSPITSTITVQSTHGACIGTPVSFTITVNPVQNVTASYSPNPACLGQSISLTSTPSGGTYTWTGPSGYASAMQNPTAFTPTWSSGTFTISAIYSGYTCTNTVTVVMHPHPSIAISPTNPTICAGSCLALTASAGTGTTYTWQPGSLTGSTVTVCPATSTTYTIFATSSFGCTGSTNAQVTVANNFSFNVSPPNATVDAGQCATFHITTAGTYTWTPSLGLNTTVGSTVTACPATTTTYTVMGVNGSGCTATTLVTVHITGNYIEDVSGSSPCPLPYLAILNIADNFVQQNDTILYNLNYGDGADSTFTVMYQNNPTPLAAITHAYTAMGTYSPFAILQHTNGLSDTIHTQNLIVASDTCGDISGKVFVDVNSNCIADIGDNPVSNQFVKLYNGTTLIQAQFTDANGFYCFNVPNGNYTLKIDSSYFNSYALLCPVGGSYAISGIPATNKNFGLACLPGFDLYGMFTAGGTFRPGSSSHFCFRVGNFQSIPTTASVKLYMDHRTTYTYTNPAPTSINGDTITWLIPNLATPSNAYRNFWVSVMDSPTLVIGDSVHYCLSVTPTIGDINVLNNNSCAKWVCTNSYDPNEKTVSPAGDITKNTDLTYTVHFQNTGNAEAYNIYILDTLDAHLDLSTLEMVAASHPYSVEILNSTQKDVLKFFFPNIMLPDSGSNQMLSNGFVSYKIRPLGNCVEGTIITNLADIYFDYNPAIVTNMVQNQIPLLLAVNEETNNSTRDRVIPNPVSQQATLTYAVPEQGKTLIKLFDITGKETLTLLNQDLDPGEHHLTFDCKDLKSGIYFIRITTIRSSSVVKLVKL